jgi:GT2 family glycosyltransferase
VRALLDSSGVDLEVVVVDNGCTRSVVDQVAGLPGVTLLRPGHNTGFTGGCNLGARALDADVLVFVNSDAVVEADAVRHLVSRATDPAVGIATASVRLMDRPEVINSAGNAVHFTGLSWAGELGAPAADHAQPGPVASASGCAMAVRREAWEYLGGFCEEMFAYCEDAELSLRCWQAGWSVDYVPEAVVLHRYEFSRHPQKLYLLERNRLLMVLTVFGSRTLLLLAMPLLALEVATAAVAARQGWLGQKARGWWWLATRARRVAQRRADVQRARRRSDRVLAPLLTGRFTPGQDMDIPSARALSAVASAYWGAVRRLLR